MANQKSAGSLMMLAPAQLKTHPRNMRRAYPVDQVRQMGQSIRDVGGLIQALIVTPDGQPGTYYVVDGNMRLAGARFLGQACPPLKAEIVSMERAEQLLAMIVANTMRFDVDPVSEALHYQALRGEGLSVADICGQTGVYPTRIYKRLELLKLEGKLQQMIADGKLSSDERVVAALMSLPDADTRVKLAAKLEGASIKAILAACERLNESIRERAEREPARARRATSSAAPVPTPLIQEAQKRSGLGLPANHRPEWGGLRAAARQMCNGCDVKVESLKDKFDEPAWTLIAHEAGEVCGSCSVRDVAGACQGCPGVELLSRLIRAAHAKTPHVGEQIPTERRI